MKPGHWLALALVAGVAAILVAGLSWRPAVASSGEMPTATKKPTADKPTAKRPPRAFRLGYAAGVIRVKPGVDLTKPTAPDKKAA